MYIKSKVNHNCSDNTTLDALAYKSSDNVWDYISEQLFHFWTNPLISLMSSMANKSVLSVDFRQKKRQKTLEIHSIEKRSDILREKLQKSINI